MTSTGTLVSYEHQGALLLGVVTKEEKKGVIVLNERGRESRLPTNRLHSLPGKIPGSLSTTAEQAEFLSTEHEKAAEKAREIELVELWTAVQDEKDIFTNAELSELWFQSAELHSYLATRIALLSDYTYFKRKNDAFEPRTAETVEELKKKQAAEKKQLELEKVFSEAVTARLADPNTPWPKETESIVETLIRVAAQGTNVTGNDQKEAKRTVALCEENCKVKLDGALERKCFALLKQTGEINDYTNLALVRNEITIDFTEEQLAFQLSDCSDDGREDLTDLDTFTIDDVSTRDRDDALSLVPTINGYQLGIHISDAAALIEKDSPLDRLALSRATSVYLPEMTINMLPDHISEDGLSLLEETKRACISCLIELDQNHSISGTKVVRSTVRVRKNYSYDEVEGVLAGQGQSEFHTVKEIADNFESERLNNGGFSVPKRDVKVKVNEDNVVEIEELEERSPARAMIGEMMIKANSIFAVFLSENEAPAIYRCQKPPQEDRSAALEGVPEGLAHEYLQRGGLTPSYTSSTPEPHAMLGLDGYCQVTSPIRRYLDLAMQRQIVAVLKGEPCPYTDEELKEILITCDLPVRNSIAVQRESKRFWLQHYLRQRVKKGGKVTVTVLRTDLRTPLVQIHDVYLNVQSKLPTGSKQGDVLELEIHKNSPVWSEIKLGK